MPAPKIHWDSMEDGFCESVISGPPEYAGAFSSLAMSIFGLLGLFISRNTNILLRVIASALAVTGVGSFAYHWTLYAGWGMMDSVPMLISSWMGAYMAFDGILYRRVAIDRNKRRDYELWSGVLALIFMSAMVVSIVFSIIEEYSHLFSLLFLVAELCIALAVILIRCLSHRDMGKNPEFKKAFRYMWGGFGIAVLAAVIWFTVETLCPRPKYHWLRYTYAHSMWHTCISLGMYYLMQFFIFVHAHNVGNQPHFIKRTGFQGLLFTIIPAVEYGRMKPANLIISSTSDGFD